MSGHSILRPFYSPAILFSGYIREIVLEKHNNIFENVIEEQLEIEKQLENNWTVSGMTDGWLYKCLKCVWMNEEYTTQTIRKKSALSHCDL